MVVDQEGSYQGTIAASDLYITQANEQTTISSILKKSGYTIQSNDSLSKGVELMSEQQEESIPVISADKHKVIGLLTYRDILKAYHSQIRESKEAGINLSLKRQRMKIMIKGRNFYKSKNPL